MPVISSNPATGLALGVAGQYAFRGKNPESVYSSINGSATYTLKNQLMIQLKNNIFLKRSEVSMTPILSKNSKYVIFVITCHNNLIKQPFNTQN